MAGLKFSTAKGEKEMKENEKKLIHDAIEQIKKCHEKHDMESVLMLIRLCKYIAGDSFQVSLETGATE